MAAALHDAHYINCAAGGSADARLLQKSAGVITRSIAVHAARAARCTSALLHGEL